MSTRIGISFGLALTLVLGIVVTMLAFGMFAPSKVGADSHPPTVNNSPNTAGELAEYQFQFQVSAVIPANTGEIEIIMHKDVGMPTSIPRSAILVSSSQVVTGTAGTPAAGGQVVPLTFDPTFDVWDTDTRYKVIRMKVPDLDQSDTTAGAGVQNIAADANVTVTFSTSAGIKNPTEESTINFGITARAITGGPNLIERATPNPTMKVYSKIFLSSADGDRGGTLTVVGRGFNNGTTATVWLDNGVDLDGDGTITVTQLLSVDETISGVDVNVDGDALDTDVTEFSEVALGFDLDGDGVADKTTVTSIQETDFRKNAKRDKGERDLGGAIVGADDTFTHFVTIGNPPFLPGSTLKNVINAIDGEDRAPSPDNSREFKLKPLIIVSPNEIATGDTVTISFKDFTPGGEVNGITLAGVPVDIVGVSSSEKAIKANGETTFTVKIPGAGVPIGVQSMMARTNINDSDTVNLTILGATLSLSHDSIIANQDLTISGSGFTEDPTSTVCIAQGSITISNVPLMIDSDSRDTACGTGTKITSGGTFVATVIVRSTDTTEALPSALLTAGNHELKVTDSSGTEGTLPVQIKPRSLVLTPEVARPRETLTIRGSGFPGDNPDVSSPSVRIVYNCGTGCTRSITAEPDVSGNFTENIRVPRQAPIPSTNTITAEVTVSTIDTITHDVPKASISVSPESGMSGDQIVLSGVGFRDFDAVEKVTVGGNGALGGRTINTDSNGTFSDNIIVPGLDPGIHSLVVTVGTGADETTANTTFTVIETPVGPTPGVSGATETVFADVITRDNLVRVWRFNNADKSWSFYDPRPAFAAANTMTEATGGNIVWVNLGEDQMFQGQLLTAGWNQIVLS